MSEPLSDMTGVAMRVQAALQRLAGPETSVASEAVGSMDGLIGPEIESVLKAVPKRRAEFAAGRRAARKAMALARWETPAIPKGEDRAPIWPSGLIGSISHDAGLAVACVARKSQVARLGVDLAEATEFPLHLRKAVLLTEPEMALDGLSARIAFSAKEAVFKAFYPEVNEFFGFGAVEVLPDVQSRTFQTVLLRPLGRVPKNTTLTGKYCIESGRILTLISTPA